MKLPQDFIPEKSLEKNEEGLLEKSKLSYNPKTLNCLLDLGKKFLEKAEAGQYKDMYGIGIESIRGLEYTLEDVEELSKKIEIGTEEDLWLGVYFSALINKVITEKDNIAYN